MSGKRGTGGVLRAKEAMAKGSRTLTIVLALILASVRPCSSEDWPPGRIRSNFIQYNRSWKELAVPGEAAGESLANAGILLRADLRKPGAEGTEPAEDPRRAEARSPGDDEPDGTGKSNGCVVERVIPGTSKQVRGFVENVNRISATEIVEQERINRYGVVIQKEHHKFNYVAEIAETRPGILNMDEYRDGSRGQNGFPGEVSTVGITSLVLIFHPYHVKEFDMTCEGADEWQGQAVWKVRFEQRMDKPARMSALRVGDANYPILLKGTAWIDAHSFQIVHLETDILKPVPEVRLTTEHQVLDYGPVQFEQKKIKLWLPLEAEIYLDVNGKRFHHRHVYSDYRVFSVDLGQKVGGPK